MSTLQEIDPDCLNDSDCDLVDTIIIPRSTDIGGFEVHRALPSSKRQMVGPFIFWDQMGPGEFLTGKGLDVRPHPHIGLSTVSYLFSGTMDHKDSLGTDIRIESGAVNLMTAGSGIVHSERTGSDIRTSSSDLFGIQSWLALPEGLAECAPDFEHTGKAALPLMEYAGVSVRVIMGHCYGRSAPVSTFMDTLYLDVEMKTGGVFELPLETEERAVYVLSGQVQIGGIAYDPMQMLVFRPGDEITVKALSDVRMMVLGGERMDGPRRIWWNFVASSKERLEQAKDDWKNGKFAKVPGDEEEFIPLP